VVTSISSPSHNFHSRQVKKYSIPFQRCYTPLTNIADVDGQQSMPYAGPETLPQIYPRGSDGGDPFSLLLKQRTVFLTTDVNDAIADSIVSQLILLDAQDSVKDIKLFINSPGGSVTAGMAIYDAMSMCKAPISTICFGLAASMGAFLLMSGTKGKRYAMPNSRIMIHQPLGGAQGVAVEVEIQAKEILFHKANINRIMSSHTGQTEDKIEIDTDRDFFMSPEEAVDYGLIDGILGLKGAFK